MALARGDAVALSGSASTGTAVAPGGPVTKTVWPEADKAGPRVRRIVDWLFDHQQKPDGSFPQNSDVAGTPVWTNLQLDEVALSIVLAHLVGRDDASTYAHVKRAADFLAGFVDPATGLTAPYSPQDRWENQSGYSPNTTPPRSAAWSVLAGRSAGRYLPAMAAASGPGDLLAEQVWDGRPPRSRPEGEGTRSATPLTWSEAGLIRLAWTMQRGTPVDRQDVVAQRLSPLTPRAARNGGSRACPSHVVGGSS